MKPLSSPEAEPLAPMRVLYPEVTEGTAVRVMNVVDSAPPMRVLGGDEQKKGRVIPFNRQDAVVPANISPSGSAESFEKKHGMRESRGKRFIKKNITGPIGEGLTATGDLLIKSMGQAKLDWFRLGRGQFSDKHMTPSYSGGVVPLPLRMLTNIGGTTTFLSLLAAKTWPGKKIISYRKRRRERIDRAKNYFGKSFRDLGSKFSHAMPWYDARFNATQKGRARIDSLNKGQAAVESWMHGGIAGMQAAAKRKKMLKNKAAEKNKVVHMVPRRDKSENMAA